VKAPPIQPVHDFLNQEFEGVSLDEREEQFTAIARLTGLRRAESGSFYLSNVWRGPLLYALIARHRPRHVLEIGTGRGYGALCMAMAAAELGLDTVIHTVDMLSPETRQVWPIDDEGGQRVIESSIRDVWRHFPGDWVDRIEFLTGTSTTCLETWLANPSSPAIEFAFIDGGHDYLTVRHDLLASVMAGQGGSVTLLLDDYGGVQGEGVRRLVDGQLSNVYPRERIHRLAMPQTEVEALDNGEHGMVYIDGRGGEIVATPQAVGGSERRTLAAFRMAAGVEAAVLRARAGAVSRVRALLGRGRRRESP